jgi:hypothetical protein
VPIPSATFQHLSQASQTHFAAFSAASKHTPFTLCEESSHNTKNNNAPCVAHAPLMLMLLTLLLTLLMEGSVEVSGTAGDGDCATTGGLGEPASQQNSSTTMYMYTPAR